MPVSTRSVLPSSEHQLASVALSPPTGGAAKPTASSTRFDQPIFIDLETRSDCDIELGGRRYASDPSTKLLSAVALIDRQIVVWAPECPKIEDPALLRPHKVMPDSYRLSIYNRSTLPEPLEEAIRCGASLCAHNADGFDRHIWRELRLPEPAHWLDTLSWTRAAGLSGSLDEAGQRLFDVGKDIEGKRLIKSLLHRDPTIEEWPVLLRYNVQDVLLLAGLYQEVRQFAEPEVLAAHYAVNTRGIGFDKELARQLIELEQEMVTAACLRAETLTNGAVRTTDLTRITFLREKLEGFGVSLPNLKRETVEAALEDGESLHSAARSILEARVICGRITSKKLQKAMELCHADGRLRDQFRYYGAHTGRWTGQGMQPHNLPKPRAGLQDAERLIPLVGDYARFAEALPTGVTMSDAVSALVRPCFVARAGHVLGIADFAGVEARVLAWCGGERRLLELFHTGGDPYCDLAGRIFGRAITRADARERNVGKIAVLGCGFGMGAKRFAMTCRQQGVDLAAVGLTAEEVVNAYRNSYPAIAGVSGLWKDIERAARRALGGFDRQNAGRCSFDHEDGNLLVQLPGSRVLCYRNACLLPRHGEAGREDLAFETPEGFTACTYGGKLTENLVSAIARDLLAAALVECERQGLPVVLHVHDEIVIEVPENEAERALRRLLEIMSTPPAWAEGLPIEVEGHCGVRYFKSPQSGAPTGRARNGTWLA